MKRNDSIRVNLCTVKEIIDRFRQKTASILTSDIIREYSGGFFSNIGIPAHQSFNAQFGKILKKHSVSLDIEEIAKDVPVYDDRGHSTTASRWAI
ncbi:MAG: hypothetical protein ACYSW8_28415 [Planctomycetota bacterium]|jgi:hypothetical protein